MRTKRGLLLLGMALVVPFYLFAALNTLLAPWDFLERNRLMLALFALAAAAAMLAFARAAARCEAFLTRHARAVRVLCVLFFFAAQLYLGTLLRFSPGSDCATCYYAAQEWVNDGRVSEYFSDWLSITPQNFGLLTLDMLVQRALRAVPALAGATLYDGIVLFNALCFAAGLWAMLALAFRLRGGVGQAVFAFNMALCLPMLYCTSELYTDALSMPFLMLGLCLLARMMRVRTERAAWALAAAAGVVILIGAEIRMTTAVAAIAAAIVLVLTARPRRMLCFAMTLAVMASGHVAFLRLRGEVLGEERLRALSLPVTHWIGMGVPDPYGIRNGGYDYQDLQYARDFDDPQERREALMERLHERLYDLRYPDRMLSALSRKTLNTFGDGTYNLRQIFDSDNTAPEPLHALLVDERTPQYRVYRHLCTGIQIAQLLFACMGVASQLRRRRAEPEDALCAVELVGAFLALAIWESNARYFFHAVPVMLAVSALGQERAARAILRRAERGRAQ